MELISCAFFSENRLSLKEKKVEKKGSDQKKWANPGSNPIEFDGIKNQTGANSFSLTPKRQK
ncbi:MAG TPA: hypothetical protein VK186_21465 [Candidatus Deferrimicrobium sp.]|nr:hypothetical protein [Candidatus Kapabacteria bacterium]HLP61425.1 hypothetical protein [Candidatus Deferrimicrobium sp.]